LATLRQGVFVDTSAWHAHLDRTDANHQVAVWRFSRLVMQRRPLITTNYVLGETYTLARRRLGARAALAFLHQARRDASIHRVHVPEDWEEDVERLLARFHDQVFSYVDATSFVTMRRLGLHEAFTFDRDFLIAGFALIGDA